jgi:hypothetical protein
MRQFAAIGVGALMLVAGVVPDGRHHTVDPGTPGFNGAWFLRLKPASADLADRFVWPVDRFRDVHDGFSSARAYSLEEVHERYEPSESALAGSPSTHAWADWTYTSTLLEIDRPLYPFEEQEPDTEQWANAEWALREEVEGSIRAGNAIGLATLREAVARQRHLRSLGWNAIAVFAEQQGELELALAVRERYLAVGACSLDDTPNYAARGYADLCYRMGRLSCFLNLQVRIMSDNFRRMAYTSMGEASHGTEASRLRDVGIDVERFFRGLLYRFHTGGKQRAEIGSWRLARALHEANLTTPMATWLRREASRTDLDDYNRFRAAQTLAYLRLHAGDLPRSWSPTPEQRRRREELNRAVRDELTGLPLPNAVAAWAAMFTIE